MNKNIDNHQKILTEWMIAVETGGFERAIQLDFYHYEHLVKATEDVKYWDLWQENTHTIRKQLTKRVVKIAPNLPISICETANKFAIVNHNYSGLAHEVQLSRNIQFLRRQGMHLDFDVIYLFESLPHARQLAARLYQIPESNLIFLSADSYKKAAEQLDLACLRVPYRTVIYPSIFNLAFWMSLFNTHPRQKFLQMKYYPWHAGRIAQWGGGRRSIDEYYNIHGFNFQQLQTLDLGVDTASADVASTSKSQGIAFGSISRPEKIADTSYNRFVESLLRKRPDLTYLYAGRQESIKVIPGAVRHMKNAVHIGWVDPAVAIKSFSIYLEPFPWGGGEMSLLALTVGVPYLSLGTEENIRFGLFDFLRMVASSGPEILQYSFCNNIDELRFKLLQLTDDAALRQQLGNAWRVHIASWRPSDMSRWYDFLMN